MTTLVNMSCGRACGCGPLSRTSGTRPPSPFGSLRSPSALRFGRPSLASYGLVGSAQRRRCRQSRIHSLATVCQLPGRNSRQITTYLAARSSVPPARPTSCVSCVHVGVGWVPYVKQRLDSCGVLGRLGAVRSSLQTLELASSPWWACEVVCGVQYLVEKRARPSAWQAEHMRGPPSGGPSSQRSLHRENSAPPTVTLTRLTTQSCRAHPN
jgi:hypothetical protein